MSVSKSPQSRSDASQKLQRLAARHAVLRTKDDAPQWRCIPVELARWCAARQAQVRAPRPPGRYRLPSGRWRRAPGPWDLLAVRAVPGGAAVVSSAAVPWNRHPAPPPGLAGRAPGNPGAKACRTAAPDHQYRANLSNSAWRVIASGARPYGSTTRHELSWTAFDSGVVLASTSRSRRYRKAGAGSDSPWTHSRRSPGDFACFASCSRIWKRLPCDAAASQHRRLRPGSTGAAQPRASR